MSIIYCENCNTKIDLDYDDEHEYIDGEYTCNEEEISENEFMNSGGADRW